LLTRLNTLLFISAKLLDTNRANNALLWAMIHVDKVIAWAKRTKEWTSRLVKEFKYRFRNINEQQ
jgi:hypothetical protein